MWNQRDQLYMNTFLNLDIDECEEASYECEQICHNSVGSYACSCHIGYRLDGDRLTCNGMTGLHVYKAMYYIIIIFAGRHQ